MLVRILLAVVVCFGLAFAGAYLVQNPPNLDFLKPPPPAEPKVTNFEEWVFPPTERPYDTKPADRVAAWWRWAASHPVADGPLGQLDVKDLSRGQTKPVWFLPDCVNPARPLESTTVKRTYNVPAGVALALPAVNLYAISRLIPDTKQATFAQKFGREHFPLLEDLFTKLNVHEVSLDGFKSSDPLRFRVQSPVPFPVTFREDVLHHFLPTSDVAEPGKALVVADGIHVLFKPLPPGDHTIRVRYTRRTKKNERFVDATLLVKIAPDPKAAKPAEPAKAGDAEKPADPEKPAAEPEKPASEPEKSRGE